MQSLNNLVRIININTNKIYMTGDSTHRDGSCISLNRHLMEIQKQTSGNETWTLECWGPLQCIIEIRERAGFSEFNLIPDDFTGASMRLTDGMISPRTLFLPLTTHDTVSYTFLPLSIGRIAAFFMTSILSGCGFFVAKPVDNKVNCNLIAIHANVFCRNVVNDDVDYHHRQAVAVLDRVHPMNDQCRYKLSARWAPSHHKPVISKSTLPEYHYENEVQYYEFPGGGVFLLYAYNFGGNIDEWTFCIISLKGVGQGNICIVV